MYTGGAAVGALLAPIVATTALGFIGFSAAGPVAGHFLSPHYVRLTDATIAQDLSRPYSTAT